VSPAHDGDAHLAPQLYGGYFLRQDAVEDTELTHVAPGTPCGEYMRRFWQPVTMTSELKERPLAVRLLGEDLVLYRDLSGTVGLLHRACSHRRTSLEFGRIERNGLRCCYHGWLFGADGRILETPGEPESSRIRHTVCQGAYPIREYKGLIFAYMGPPALKPEFPIFDTFEHPETDCVPYFIDYPCNWLQVHENTIDPFHTVFLHQRVSGTQFSDAFGEMPIVEWHEMPNEAGVFLTNVRRVGDRLWVRTQETFRPNFSQTGDIWQDVSEPVFFNRVGLSKWIVPVDNTHCRTIGWRYFNASLDLKGKGNRAIVGPQSIDFVGQTEQRTYAERQDNPGDFEAIISQGAIHAHSLEHLGYTDSGVARVRQKLRSLVRKVAAGAPVPAPTRNADGLLSSYTQDTIIRFPARENDAEVRRAVARRIGQIIVETDELGRAERQAEIARRVTQEFVS